MYHIKKKKLSDWLWDIWCVASVIGIWPRFIEPKLLAVTQQVLPIPDLPSELSGLKILQFSDLHWNAEFSSILAKKLVSKIRRLKPDIIVFTGDLLCRSRLENPEKLREILCLLEAPYGCFAVLGNHDYEKFITVNPQGDYDVDRPSLDSDIEKGFGRLFRKVEVSKTITPAARNVDLQPSLLRLFENTPFKLLNNTTQLVAFKQSYINLCGLEEYTTGRLDPVVTFKNYDERYPGIILCHNPDAIPCLARYPGNVILSGHTHGGQVNLPGMWKRFSYMENQQFKRGLKKEKQKWVYINRGISSVMKFRWFSIPEISLFTLQQE